MGFGTAKSEFHFRDFADPTNNFSGEGDWSGTGFVGGAFMGYRFGLSPLASLFLRGGYRYRNLGEFSGDSYRSDTGSGSGSPQDNAGNPLDFDFSGVYIRAGFGLGFGG